MNLSHAWHNIAHACLCSESECLDALRAILDTTPQAQQAIADTALSWIRQLREQPRPAASIEILLREYRLSTPEGIALLCLAEALLRVPDPAVADALIRDVLSPVAWHRHAGSGDSLFLQAANWGLALTGRWLAATEQPQGDSQPWLRRLAGKLGEPVLRQALKKTMRHLAREFVLGENLPAALRRARKDWKQGYSHSFDMLGEAALTAADGERYSSAYRDAIAAAADAGLSPDLEQSGLARPDLTRPGISIKLSALHPRYQSQQWPRLQQELVPRLCALAEQAGSAGIDLAIDAEEADRLELSLRIYESVMAQLSPPARAHLGIVVQAYGKRALPILQWLGALAGRMQTRIKLRLVKGAYWDTEIKRAQIRGLGDYPVFTDKTATDISYLACASWLLQHPEQFFPQFATHNAVTIAAILALQPDHRCFELQRLHGMGTALYDIVREQHKDLRCRIYAPIGAHRELLPYLVRRLLENGANTSFVHQLYDPDLSATALATHPLAREYSKPLPLPTEILLPRHNAPGIYWHTESERLPFLEAINAHARSIYDFRTAPAGNGVEVRSPADASLIGYWHAAAQEQISNALTAALGQQRLWQNTSVEERAGALERCAALMLENRAELVALMARETGKTLENGLEEVREAMDFCRYYAEQGRPLFGAPLSLPGPVGEDNQLSLQGRGLIACISPWNFPLSIFIGQIAAALIAGNAVLAKPAEQSTLTALYATQLLHRAGIPQAVLHTLPGAGESVGAALCADPRIDGVVFTGAWDTARAIARQLAERDGAIIPFIAETAGLNALIADSSAQPQQLVLDVLRSAFDSAGQRCSALRVLYLPETCAGEIERLLCGAMRELQLGNPLDWRSDIGPIIDSAAHRQLREHIERFRRRDKVIFQSHFPTHGLFMAPTLIRLEQIGDLQREAFGPVLHIIHYNEHQLDAVIDEINHAGFGLTCGIHSRNERKAKALAQRLRVGNCYINRDIIGAVVGVQPFGGCGKSGTGPKAGGPHYLARFAQEKTITVNTAALGGDQRLLSDE